MAAGIRGGHGGRLAFLQVRQLAVEQFRGLLGLGDVVDAGAAAAPVGFRQVDHLQPGDGIEDGARLVDHLLAVAQVAALVVGGAVETAARGGLAEARRDQPLVDVLDLGVPLRGACGVERIIMQQMTVFLQVRAAAACVGDDGIKVVQIEAVDLLAGEYAGEVHGAVVGVQRAAAMLVTRSDDFTAIGQQHIGGIAIDPGKHQILDAAREQAHPVLRGGRTLHRVDEFVGKMIGDHRRLRLQLAQVRRHQMEELVLAQETLHPGALVKPHGTAHEAQQHRVHEQNLEREPAPEFAFRARGGAGALDFGPRGFKQVGILHSRRAGGFAGQATQAVVHLIGEFARDGQVAIGDGAHESDAAPGAVALALGLHVSGAGGQAHAAVHALLDHGVVHCFEKVDSGGHAECRLSD